LNQVQPIHNYPSSNHFVLSQKQKHVSLNNSIM